MVLFAEKEKPENSLSFLLEEGPSKGGNDSTEMPVGMSVSLGNCICKSIVQRRDLNRR